jgi:hypothetical protein
LYAIHSEKADAFSFFFLLFFSFYAFHYQSNQISKDNFFLKKAKKFKDEIRKQNKKKSKKKDRERCFIVHMNSEAPSSLPNILFVLGNFINNWFHQQS